MVGEVPLRVAVFSCYFPPAFRGGGPATTLGSMMANLPDGTKAVVVAQDTDLGATVRLDVPGDEWLNHGDAKVRFISSRSVASWLRAIKAVRSFHPDVVYVNSFFDHLFSLIPHMLVRMKIFGRASILIAPRGEFSEGALALHPRRKRFVLALFRITGLRRGVTWHASAPPEQEDIRRVMGRDAAVVVRENDTDLPSTSFTVPTRADGPLRVVHLARLSPKKGLDILLSAMTRVSLPLALDIFGPEEDVRFAEQCRRLASALPEHVGASFRGPLDHAEVRQALAAYDLMALPTRGENFGHVIAESLSASCPVMCPDNTPWSDVLRDGGGVVVTPDTIDQWTQSLDEYARLASDELTANRRQAARAYEGWHQAAATKPHLFALLERTTAKA